MDQSDNNNQSNVPPASVATQQDPQMNVTPPSGASDSSIPTQTQQENMNQTDNNPPAAPVETPVPSQDQQEDAGVSSAQQSDSTTDMENTPQEEDYVTNVGISAIDLFTDISMSEQMKQKVAETMRIPVSQVTTIVDQLLDKIDNEQITEEELAFIMSAPVVDEIDEVKNP